MCAGCGVRLSRYNKEAICSACSKAGAPTRSGSTPIPTPREAWLYVGSQSAAPPDGSNVGELMRSYRESRHMTQQQLADLLKVDSSFVSLVENGKRAMRDIVQLRRVAGALEIPPEELGLLPVPAEFHMPGEVHSDAAANLGVAAGAEGQSHTTDSQRNWRRIRRLMNQHRNELSSAARRLYPSAGDVRGVLSKADWMAPTPIALDRIQLAWNNQLAPPRVVGAEQQAHDVLPLQANGRQYERYSRAIAGIERPTLFENRVSFRLSEVEWTSSAAYLGFGYTTYFDMVDVCEAVAHETAAAWHAFGETKSWLNMPNWTRLPFRSMLHDPFDLSARALLPSIDTLTIRVEADGSASFLLHRRNSANVALAGGYYHVMPCGVFQPSTLAPWDQSNDFDLWRNMMREFSEEFLGMPEADGSSGAPIDYGHAEPFRSLTDARNSGALRASCFGIGLDPLTLAGEILSVVVIESDVYDRVFADLVSTNSEGSVVAASPSISDGIPFTEENVRRLLDDEPLAPAAAACLDLAWQHRAELF
jgi:transcriptional regulator with XRE-family HTH domain